MDEKPWRESVAFGSRADSKYLADSKESCGFEYDLPILENLADYESLADSRWGMMMIAGFPRVIYPKESSSKVQASREAGRGISNESVV